MNKPLYDDPVVAEIHAIRAQMLTEHGGDPRKMMEEVIRHQVESGRKVRKAPALPPPINSTANSGLSNATLPAGNQ